MKFPSAARDLGIRQIHARPLPAQISGREQILEGTSRTGWWAAGQLGLATKLESVP